MAKTQTKEIRGRDLEKDGVASPRRREDSEGSGSAANPTPGDEKRDACLRPCRWSAQESTVGA